MMPISVLNNDEEAVIVKIGGTKEVRKHLEDLGFIVGSSVKVIIKNGDNIIVKVKEARIAISQEMANKIYV